MRKRKEAKNTTVKSLLIIIPGVLLALNLVMAQLNPDYASSVSGKINLIASAISGDRLVVLKGQDGPALAQGGIKGINIQKAEEGAKAAKDKAEGKAAAPTPAAAGKGGAAAPKGKKKKEAKPIDPETLKKALDSFQTSLLNRDVILIGQTDKVVLGDKEYDKPYISSSFRDNPFDMVEQTDINPSLALNRLPPEPFYPPPGSSTVNVTGDEFKKYIETLKLNGILEIGGKNFAIFNAGARNYIKSAGDEYKDKFTVNLDDISLDGVIVSDEFGNKGILDFAFRKGFQVQPVDNALFISNIGMKE